MSQENSENRLFVFSKADRQRLLDTIKDYEERIIRFLSTEDNPQEISDAIKCYREEIERILSNEADRQSITKMMKEYRELIAHLLYHKADEESLSNIIAKYRKHVSLLLINEANRQKMTATITQYRDKMECLLSNVDNCEHIRNEIREYRQHIIRNHLINLKIESKIKNKMDTETDETKIVSRTEEKSAEGEKALVQTDERSAEFEMMEKVTQATEKGQIQEQDKIKTIQVCKDGKTTEVISEKLCNGTEADQMSKEKTSTAEVKMVLNKCESKPEKASLGNAATLLNRKGERPHMESRAYELPQDNAAKSINEFLDKMEIQKSKAKRESKDKTGDMKSSESLDKIERKPSPSKRMLSETKTNVRKPQKVNNPSGPLADGEMGNRNVPHAIDRILSEVKHVSEMTEKDDMLLEIKCEESMMKQISENVKAVNGSEEKAEQPHIKKKTSQVKPISKSAETGSLETERKLFEELRKSQLQKTKRQHSQDKQIYKKAMVRRIAVSQKAEREPSQPEQTRTNIPLKNGNDSNQDKNMGKNVLLEFKRKASLVSPISKPIGGQKKGATSERIEKQPVQVTGESNADEAGSTTPSPRIATKAYIRKMQEIMKLRNDRSFSKTSNAALKDKKIEKMQTITLSREANLASRTEKKPFVYKMKALQSTNADSEDKKKRLLSKGQSGVFVAKATQVPPRNEKPPRQMAKTASTGKMKWQTSEVGRISKHNKAKLTNVSKNELQASQHEQIPEKVEVRRSLVPRKIRRKPCEVRGKSTAETVTNMSIIKRAPEVKHPLRKEPITVPDTKASMFKKKLSEIKKSQNKRDDAKVSTLGKKLLHKGVPKDRALESNYGERYKKKLPCEYESRYTENQHATEKEVFDQSQESEENTAVDVELTYEIQKDDKAVKMDKTIIEKNYRTPEPPEFSKKLGIENKRNEVLHVTVPSRQAPSHIPVHKSLKSGGFVSHIPLYQYSLNDILVFNEIEQPRMSRIPISKEVFWYQVECSRSADLSKYAGKWTHFHNDARTRISPQKRNALTSKAKPDKTISNILLRKKERAHISKSADLSKHRTSNKDDDRQTDIACANVSYNSLVKSTQQEYQNNASENRIIGSGKSAYKDFKETNSTFSFVPKNTMIDTDNKNTWSQFYKGYQRIDVLTLLHNYRAKWENSCSTNNNISNLPYSCHF